MSTKVRVFVDTDKIFLGKFLVLPKNLTFVKRKGLLSQAILNINIIIQILKGVYILPYIKRMIMRKYKTNHLDSKVVGYDSDTLGKRAPCLNRAFVLLKQIFVLLLSNKINSS